MFNTRLVICPGLKAGVDTLSFVHVVQFVIHGVAI